MALGFSLPSTFHRRLYRHGLVPDQHPSQSEQEASTSPDRLLRSYYARRLSRLTSARSQHRWQSAPMVPPTRHRLTRPCACHALSLPLHRIHAILGPRTNDPSLTDHPLPHSFHILWRQLVFSPSHPPTLYSLTDPGSQQCPPSSLCITSPSISRPPSPSAPPKPVCASSLSPSPRPSAAFCPASSCAGQVATTPTTLSRLPSSSSVLRCCVRSTDRRRSGQRISTSSQWDLVTEVC